MKMIKKISTLFLAAAVTIGSILGVPVKAQAATQTDAAGTFTVAAMNVDGLPQQIKVLFVNVDLNKDGPGSEGTKKISAKIATKGWDFFSVAEDFNYNTELMGNLAADYNSGTYRGGVSGFENNTDGLNLIWKNTLAASGETWIPWKVKYSSGRFNTGNGADHMIDKGYRFYQLTVAEGVTVDVYILHMDADADAEDIAAREAELEQLSTAIKASNNGNPIIVMGDTNCRYTREKLKSGFIDVINADERFTINDCWIEKCKNGAYPAYGSASLMVGDLGYVEGEIVDKMFYINNTDSDVELTLNTFKVDTDFNDTDGTPLADHYPVVGEFAYTFKTPIVGTTPHVHTEEILPSKEATCTETGLTEGTKCSECGEVIKAQEVISAKGHTYEIVSGKDATCTVDGLTEGSKCNVCGEVQTEQTVIPAKGHNYVDGVCTVCQEKDPNYVEPTVPVDPVEPVTPAEPASDMVLGREVAYDEVQSGEQYAIYFQSTYDKYPLMTQTGVVTSDPIRVQTGDAVTEDSIWTLTKTANGWTLSQNIDGKEYYLANTNQFYGVGYKVGLSETPFEWQMTDNGIYSGIRFYTKLRNGSKNYLRYYNTRVDWVIISRSAAVKVYEVQ